MNPHQKNKIDISKLSAEEQKIFRLYGKVPSRGDLLQNKLKERKYFDSGDYALSKAGKASDVGVTSIGSQHPSPENIPHASSPGPQANASTANGVSGSSSSGNNVPGVGSGLEKTISGENIDQDGVQDGEGNTGGAEGESQKEQVLSPGKEIPVRWQS